MKYVLSRFARRRIDVAKTFLLCFCLAISCVQKGFAQENNIGNDSHLAAEERMATRLSPVEEKQHRFYLNLGLTPGTGYSGREGVGMFQETSLNFTSYTAWGFVGEVGVTGRPLQGWGGRVMAGYEVMRLAGWHIFPYVQGAIQAPASFSPLTPAPFNQPRFSAGAGLGTDYEIPGTRLMLGLRAGYNFAFMPEFTLPDFMGGTRTLPAGVISSPDVQLRFGLRIGE